MENKEFKKVNPAIKVIPFPGIDGAYIVISASWKERVGDYEQFNIKKNMTFFYDGGNGIGAEWEPNYGPITIHHSCDENHEKAKPHFFYPFYDGDGDWEQLAVEKHELPEKFISGRYDELFNVLKMFCG